MHFQHEVHIFLFLPLCQPSISTLPNLSSMAVVILSSAPSECAHVLWCWQQHKGSGCISWLEIANHFRKKTEFPYLICIKKVEIWANCSHQNWLYTFTRSGDPIWRPMWENSCIHLGPVPHMPWQQDSLYTKLKALGPNLLLKIVKKDNRTSFLAQFWLYSQSTARILININH